MSVKTVQAIVNGQTINLTLNSSTGNYEATMTAPIKSSWKQSGHYYNATIKATDDAGNVTTVDASDPTLGTSLQLQVKEKVAPTIQVVSPTASATLTNNKPSIIWKVLDDDSGVDVNKIGVTIDSEAKVTGQSIVKTEISGGYQCTYTPDNALSDGNHTIKFDATDNDGNAATQESVTFKVDTVPPVLSINSPADGLVTNQTSITVSGTTNDTTSSPVEVTVKLNSGAAEKVTVSEDGSFSKNLTLKAGSNTITVTATDGAGKTSIVTRTVLVDIGAPVIHSVKITPNPVDAGKTYVISVKVTDE